MEKLDNVSLLDQFARQIAALAGDRHSGASQLTREAYRLLGESFAHQCTLEVAVALCRAQPSMASIWFAALVAVSLVDSADAEPVEEAVVMPTWASALLRFERAERSLERMAVSSLRDGVTQLRVVTCSMSGSVVRVLQGLHAHVPIHVSCSESRPLYEGRLLAETLTAAGIPSTLFTDAALALALDDADMVLVGADAVGPSHWINKVGTRSLAAAAQHRGVPLHVLATSDKLVSPALWPHLAQPDHAPSEVWDGAPAAVVVRNPYFEAIALDLATSLITDKGVLGTDMVRDACAAHDTPALRKALDELLRARD